MAESFFSLAVGRSGTLPGSDGTSIACGGGGAMGAGAPSESPKDVAGAAPAPAYGSLGSGPDTLARGSSAAAKPDDAGVDRSGPGEAAP
jgi:hypothetical protein